jgi:hypothetical protein
MKDYKNWKKTTEINGIIKSLEVKEAENGYMIYVSKCGFNSSEGSPEKYIDEKKCWISSENPLEGQKEEDIDFDIEEAFKYFKEL